VAVAGVALTGAGMPEAAELQPQGGAAPVTVRLLPPGDGAKAALKDAVEASRAAGKVVIAIDFTHPSAVNANAELYCELGIPFVMGTTGGDRDKLMQVVNDSGIYALIAPNMCKQIVAFQAMMEFMSEQYPGAFGGYSLQITESHQSSKADTSGTAKKMVEYLNVLKGGSPITEEDIVKLRESDKQLAFGVPEGSLDGHAWHTYTLTSSDGSVIFEFKHNVCGRRTYAEGVVDAVSFLAAKIEEASEQKVFNMIDVLRAGQMQ